MSETSAAGDELAFLEQLLGSWIAEGQNDAGAYRVERHYERTLGNRYISLQADWQMGEYRYQELALIGSDRNGSVRLWSFASDGGQSIGRLASASDLPAGAFAFEADMPDGRARTIYSDSQDGTGFTFAAEAQVSDGWERFLEHYYRPLAR